MKNNNVRSFSSENKIRKDCFNASIVADSTFDGFYDMPLIGQKTIIVPERLVSYEKIKNHNYEGIEFVHFYIDDYKFDGLLGLWSTIKNGTNAKRGFNIHRFDGASGIITPDYSLYLDMPIAMQIWNTYRNRAIGHYLSQKGYYVVPNVRWSDDESYDFAFSGIEKNGIVSVGTNGCYKRKADKYLFEKGFIEMIKRLKPVFIIIYGAVSSKLIAIMKINNIRWKQFDSETHMYFKEKQYGIKC